jgi:hypothetical protein
LRVSKNIVEQTILQENRHITVTEASIFTWDRYLEDTKWADHNVIIPTLFDLLHGIEVMLKGFLIASGQVLSRTHRLSELLEHFESEFPGHPLGQTARKYILRDHLPELLATFCDESGITMDDYYQALKYPESSNGQVYTHRPLKYQGENGLPFFETLNRDLKTMIHESVALSRSICPGA